MFTTQSKWSNFCFVHFVSNSFFKVALHTEVTFSHCLHHQAGGLKLASTDTNC